MDTRLIISAALSLSLVGGVSVAEAGQHHRGGGGGGGSTGSVGRAVPRSVAPATIGPRGVVGGVVGVRPLYRPYYYSPYYSPWFGFGVYGGYPYGYYPYGYGYGLGYGYGYPYGYGSPYGYVSGGYAGTSYGGVRITDAPEDAAVYADGYYVGTVGDFNGTFQRLNLEAGPHHIEIMPPQGAKTGSSASPVSPGSPVSPVSFDVNVRPGQTVTYRANP